MDRVGVHLTLVPGGTSVVLELVASAGPLGHVYLGEPEVNDLIWRLSERRADMRDPVSPALEPGNRTVGIIDPLFQTKVIPYAADAQGVAVAFRHPGLGWVSFVFPPEQAAMLGQTLVNQAAIASSGDAT